MLKWLQVHIVIILAFISCESVLQNAGGTSLPLSDSMRVEIDPNDTLPTAICLWEKVGLREEPGRNKNIKYITPILLGETVFMLGETQKVVTEDRTYIKVRLSDGQEGWVYRYLFGIDAKLVAISKATSIYRRPDPMMLKTDKFEEGEIVALIDEQGEWVKVLGWQKKKVGWIKKESNLTENLEDVKVAVLYQRAVHERELEKKVDLLKTILENTSINSQFLDMVRTDLNESSVLLNQGKIKEDQLRITVERVNLRSSPNLTPGNILANIDEGTVCDVISIWPSDTVHVEGMKQHTWFKIVHEGKQGWIDGALTSVVPVPTNNFP